MGVGGIHFLGRFDLTPPARMGSKWIIYSEKLKIYLNVPDPRGTLRVPDPLPYAYRTPLPYAYRTPHKVESEPTLIEKGPLGPFSGKILALQVPARHPFCARGAFLLTFYLPIRGILAILGTF